MWRAQVAACGTPSNRGRKPPRRLDQLKIIEYRPSQRVRKLTARNFSWRKDGPVHKFFLTRFVPEYFQSAFDGAGDALPFVGGTLSAESLAQFKASLERLAAEFEVLARNDARLPLAMRKMRFSP